MLGVDLNFEKHKLGFHGCDLVGLGLDLGLVVGLGLDLGLHLGLDLGLVVLDVLDATPCVCKQVGKWSSSSFANWQVVQPWWWAHATFFASWRWRWRWLNGRGDVISFANWRWRWRWLNGLCDMPPGWRWLNGRGDMNAHAAVVHVFTNGMWLNGRGDHVRLVICLGEVMEVACFAELSVQLELMMIFHLILLALWHALCHRPWAKRRARS